jgi:hypothetical protein
MKFSIMVLSNLNGSVLNSSIFGVIDKAADLGVLPSISDKGFWESYRTIREDRFKFAAEAKKSIAECGYYLIGGKVNVTEIENSQLDEH